MRKSILLFSVILLLIAPLSLVKAFQESELSTLPGLIDDVKKLEQKTNIARLESIESLLIERDIPYEIEAYAHTKKDNYPRSEGKNVIIPIGPGTKDIVVGGHWDAAWIEEGLLSNGIVDNGCAIIILIRLAEELQKAKLNHCVKVVLFDMEEIGYWGAKAYVAKHKNDEIDYMINLDVCGAGNTIVFGNREKLGRGNPIHQTFKEVCVNNDFNFIEFPKFPMCDEKPFYKAGIQSIMISLIPEYEAHIMWLRLNKPGGGKVRGGFGETEYLHSMHTINDTVELADPVGMTLCYKAVLETILRLDKM